MITGNNNRPFVDQQQTVLDMTDNDHHIVMENGENQHTFIKRSEIAFPSARHSMVQ